LEVILSDDCSNDPGLAAIANIPNLLTLKPTSNLGFLRHANWAVAQSRGKYVLLLNNDTVLQAGAIDALHRIAEANPDVGLVGSKLLYPDGPLQEAGGIVWNDGSAWNYGHLDDPERPEYNYVRDADYISGASILIPRTVWDQLEGFDERYAPAYCEDSDFAFRVRALGMRVLYAPESVVFHYEGVSHGTDVSSGLKAYQVRNSAILKERWAERLMADHYAPGTKILRARDRARDRRVVLIVDHYVPEPDRDAGSRTMVEMIRSLRMSGAVVKFWPENLFNASPYTRDLQQMGVEVLYSPYSRSFWKWLSAHADELDVVILSRPTVAPTFIGALRTVAPHLPIVFYGHDLHAQRMRLQATAENDSLLLEAAQEMEKIERQIWCDVDMVTYPSITEVDIVRQMEPGRPAMTILPYCFDHFPAPRAPVSTKEVLFVGGFGHPPNIDAACWLAGTIFPLVLAAVPQAKLFIAGSNPTSRVVALGSDAIEVTGSLTADELATRYQSARVAVVPLRYGAGVKLKVVEALHSGVPLVTTSTGAQGIPDLETVSIVNDDPAEIAEALVRLLRDDDTWADVTARQLTFARERFSREQSIAALTAAIEAAVRCARYRLV
jgi:GT2 family glycosyltransferase/glycosyltransferase involved in cell wall biosynthesis